MVKTKVSAVRQCASIMAWLCMDQRHKRVAGGGSHPGDFWRLGQESTQMGLQALTVFPHAGTHRADRREVKQRASRHAMLHRPP